LDSKTIGAIIVFSALALVLNLSPFKIPAPYATFLIYQIWEIPIVAAFLLYGPKVGVTVAVINTLALLLIFTGELPTGPLYNLAAVLSMLFGIYVVHKIAPVFKGKFVGVDSVEFSVYLMLIALSIVGAFIQSLWWIFPGFVFGLLLTMATIESQAESSARMGTSPTSSTGGRDVLLVTTSTVVGAFARVIIMSIVNWTFLPFPPPVGFGLPQEVVIAMLPLVGVFNATLALYTIPIGHSIERVVGSRVKIAGWSQRT